jgi:hypothetical protein
LGDKEQCPEKEIAWTVMAMEFDVCHSSSMRARFKSLSSEEVLHVVDVFWSESGSKM